MFQRKIIGRLGYTLSEEQKGGMELLVSTKMEEAKERILVNWDSEEAKKHLARFAL
jgi:hypothetical protein